MKFNGYKRKLHTALDRFLAGVSEDGRVVLTVVVEKNEVQGFTVGFHPQQKYLSNLCASPDAPLSFATEGFCSAFAGIMKRKMPTVVDPLKILKDQPRKKQ